MVTHLKKSLCNLPTRRFGEFVEILTSKLNNLENPKDNSYDRTKENERIEIKGSRVFNNDNTILTEQNVLQILNEEYAILENQPAEIRLRKKISKSFS